MLGILRQVQMVALGHRVRPREGRSLTRQERGHQHRREAAHPIRPVHRHPYRWAVLAAGTAAQASYGAFPFGLPVLAPGIRAEYGLSFAQVSVVLAAPWAGSLPTLLLWGLAADRLGERLTLAAGLGACALALGASAFAPSFWILVALLSFAGAAGVSVLSASSRSITHWFAEDERGFALGVRQAAMVGGVASSLGLPLVEAHGGVEAAFLALAGLSLGGALVGGALLRGQFHEAPEIETMPWSILLRRLWRLCSAAGLYTVPQAALVGFVVLFLHDTRSFSLAAAGAVLGTSQVLAAALTIAAGRWSDVLDQRIVPLRRFGVALFATVVLAAALVDAPRPLLVPVLVMACGLSTAWTGLSFTAAAELAGHRRSGAAIGLQSSVLQAAAVASTFVFAAVVSALSWQAAFALAALFPLAGWWVLRPLSER